MLTSSCLIYSNNFYSFRLALAVSFRARGCFLLPCWVLCIKVGSFSTLSRRYKNAHELRYQLMFFFISRMSTPAMPVGDASKANQMKQENSLAESQQAALPRADSLKATLTGIV